MATSSNDWTVRLNDVRMLGAAAPDSKGTPSLSTSPAMLQVTNLSKSGQNIWVTSVGRQQEAVPVRIRPLLCIPMTGSLHALHSQVCGSSLWLDLHMQLQLDVQTQVSGWNQMDGLMFAHRFGESA